jgi:hypothetical protein
MKDGSKKEEKIHKIPGSRRKYTIMDEDGFKKESLV